MSMKMEGYRLYAEPRVAVLMYLSIILLFKEKGQLYFILILKFLAIIL
jgi:hypothetical protein